MDKSRWLTQPGIRAEKQTFADGAEHTFHFKVRTPPEVAAHLGETTAQPKDGAGAVKVQALIAKFLAESLCEEDGSPLLTLEEATLIGFGMKNELRDIIIAGSQKSVADLGKT